MQTPPWVWTDEELDESILKICEEFPDARMVTFSHALEHGRRTVPHGSPESLLVAMRGSMHADDAVIGRGPAAVV